MTCSNSGTMLLNLIGEREMVKDDVAQSLAILKHIKRFSWPLEKRKLSFMLFLGNSHFSPLEKF